MNSTTPETEIYGFKIQPPPGFEPDGEPYESTHDRMFIDFINPADKRVVQVTVQERPDEAPYYWPEP